jgi:hypothetical protein
VTLNTKRVEDVLRLHIGVIQSMILSGLPPVNLRYTETLKVVLRLTMQYQ